MTVLKILIALALIGVVGNVVAWALRKRQ